MEMSIKYRLLVMKNIHLIRLPINLVRVLQSIKQCSRFGKNSGEIAVKGIDKAQAVQFVLKELNISKQNTMAYGDGDNDIKMFEAVNYGVAMENATINLKRIAKEITSRAEDDGIFLSFQRNQLISP